MSQNERTSLSDEPTKVIKYRRAPDKTLEYLFKTKKYTDLTITLNSKHYLVHRSIVCSAIPYFDTMMYSGFKESSTGHVMINQPIDCEAFEWLIELAYSFNKEINFRNVHGLLDASDYLQIEGVFRSCCIYLDGILNVETALTVKEWISNYKVGELGNKVSIFIAKNFKAISKTKRWYELSVQLLTSYLKDGDAIGYDENEILDAIFSWTEFKPKSRQKHLASLLKLIKWGFIKPKIIIEKIAPHELVKTDESCRSVIMEVFEFIGFQSSKSSLASYWKSLRIHKYNGNVLMAFTKSSDRLDCYVLTPFSKTWKGWSNFNINLSDQFQVAVTDEFLYIHSEADKKPVDIFIQLISRDYFTCSANRLQNITSSENKIYVVESSDHSQPAPHLKATIASKEPQWSDLLALSNNLTGCGMVYLNKSLYFIGGSFGNEQSASAVSQRYDLMQSKWHLLTPMSTARYNPRVITLNGIIYVYGGVRLDTNGDNQQQLNSAEYYDPSKDKWFNMPVPENANKCKFLVPFCSKLCAFLDRRLKNVYIFDPLKKVWTEETMPSCNEKVVSVICVPNVQTL